MRRPRARECPPCHPHGSGWGRGRACRWPVMSFEAAAAHAVRPAPSATRDPPVGTSRPRGPVGFGLWETPAGAGGDKWVFTPLISSLWVLGAGHIPQLQVWALHIDLPGWPVAPSSAPRCPREHRCPDPPSVILLGAGLRGCSAQPCPGKWLSLSNPGKSCSMTTCFRPDPRPERELTTLCRSCSRS